MTITLSAFAYAELCAKLAASGRPKPPQDIALVLGDVQITQDRGGGDQQLAAHRDLDAKRKAVLDKIKAEWDASRPVEKKKPDAEAPGSVPATSGKDQRSPGSPEAEHL